MDMFKAKVLLFAILVAIESRGEDKLVGGPYVVNVGPRSATVAWVMETGQATLGSAPGAVEKKAPVLRPEKVEFTGLEPGKTYYYDATGREEGKGSFKTAPNGPVPFQFVVYGDTRTRHDMHRKVVAGILKYAAPDLVLHTGDLVADGADSAQWPVFFEIERALLRKSAFFPSLGNHERNNRQYYDFHLITLSIGVAAISSCSTVTSATPPVVKPRAIHFGENRPDGWRRICRKVRGPIAGS